MTYCDSCWFQSWVLTYQIEIESPVQAGQELHNSQCVLHSWGDKNQIKKETTILSFSIKS